MVPATTAAATPMAAAAAPVATTTAMATKVTTTAAVAASAMATTTTTMTAAPLQDLLVVGWVRGLRALLSVDSPCACIAPTQFACAYSFRAGKEREE